MHKQVHTQLHMILPPGVIVRNPSLDLFIMNLQQGANCASVNIFPNDQVGGARMDGSHVLFGRPFGKITFWCFCTEGELSSGNMTISTVGIPGLLVFLASLGLSRA